MAIELSKTDWYYQLDGDDFIPEVIVGRISVRSSNELAIVVAKTLAYEKASYINNIGSDWYEGAALIGDPSSSGQSTIHVNQYIDNLLENHGFENVETAYSGNYDGFMEVSELQSDRSISIDEIGSIQHLIDEYELNEENL